MEQKTIGTKVKTIPETARRPSQTNEILKTIKKGEILAISSTEINIQTIRSTIDKAHKKGEQTQYTIAQRTGTKTQPYTIKDEQGKETLKTKKETILYITHN